MRWWEKKKQEPAPVDEIDPYLAPLRTLLTDKPSVPPLPKPKPEKVVRGDDDWIEAGLKKIRVIGRSAVPDDEKVAAMVEEADRLLDRYRRARRQEARR